jgi:hypothetical protein
MTAAEARRIMEARIFGKIVAYYELKKPIKIPWDGEIKEYYKKLYSHITDVDRTMIEFTDTMGEIHLFKGAKVKSFRPVGMRSWKMPKKFINQYA